MSKPILSAYNKSRTEAINDGYTLDETVYPNIAYKGERFATTDWFSVPTVWEETSYQFAKSIDTAVHAFADFGKSLAEIVPLFEKGVDSLFGEDEEE